MENLNLGVGIIVFFISNCNFRLSDGDTPPELLGCPPVYKCDDTPRGTLSPWLIVDEMKNRDGVDSLLPRSPRVLVYIN
jgi:hypothetical protein